MAPVRHATRSLIALTVLVVAFVSSCSNAFLNVNGMSLLMADQQEGAAGAGWGEWQDVADVVSAPMPSDPNGGAPFDALEYEYVGQTDSYIYFATPQWDGLQSYIWGPIADLAGESPTYANFQQADVPEDSSLFPDFYDNGTDTYNYSVSYEYYDDGWSTESPSELDYQIQRINPDGSIAFSSATETTTVLSTGPKLVPASSERGDPLFSALRDRSMDAGIFDSTDGLGGSSSYESSWDGGRLIINEQTNELWIIDVISVRISGTEDGTGYTSTVPLGFITLKATFDPGSARFFSLRPLVFYASSARVEEYITIDVDWDDPDYDEGVIIHDSDDGLQPRVYYQDPGSGAGASEFHGQSVFPDLFPVADGIDEWDQQTVIDLETFVPTYSGAPIGFHPDTGLPYTFNSGGFAMALEQQDDGTYRWVMRTAGSSQTDVINLFTAYSSSQAYVPAGDGSLPSITSIPFDDGWSGDNTSGDFARLSRLYLMSMYERGGYLYTFNGSYQGFAATPTTGEQFPGFFRGGGRSLPDPPSADRFDVFWEDFFLLGDYLFVMAAEQMGGDWRSGPRTLLRARFNE